MKNSKRIIKLLFTLSLILVIFQLFRVNKLNNENLEIKNIKKHFSQIKVLTKGINLNFYLNKENFKCHLCQQSLFTILDSLKVSQSNTIINIFYSPQKTESIKRINFQMKQTGLFPFLKIMNNSKLSANKKSYIVISDNNKINLIKTLPISYNQIKNVLQKF